MTIQLSVAFSSLLMENQKSFAFYKRRNHFANDLGTFHRRKTDFHITVVIYQQHFLKLNSCPAFCVLNVLNEQFLSFFSLELLTVNFYNYVHFLFYYYTVFSARWICFQISFLPPRTNQGTKVVHISFINKSFSKYVPIFCTVFPFFYASASLHTRQACKSNPCHTRSILPLRQTSAKSTDEDSHPY